MSDSDSDSSSEDSEEVCPLDVSRAVSTRLAPSFGVWVLGVGVWIYRVFLFHARIVPSVPFFFFFSFCVCVYVCVCVSLEQERPRGRAFWRQRIAESIARNAGMPASEMSPQ